MNHLRKIQFLAVLMVGSLFLSDLAYAEGASANSAVLQEVDRLRQLKQTNPEAYQRVIQSKRQNVKKRYQNLKQNNPQKFQEFIKQEKSKKRQRLQNLKQNNPEAFERFVGQRANRLKNLQQKNPQKFNRIMQNNPRVKQKFENWKKQDFPDRSRVNRRGGNQAQDGMRRRSAQADQNPRLRDLQHDRPGNRRPVQEAPKARLENVKQMKEANRDRLIDKRVREGDASPRDRFQQDQLGNSGPMNRMRDMRRRDAKGDSSGPGSRKNFNQDDRDRLQRRANLMGTKGPKDQNSRDGLQRHRMKRDGNTKRFGSPGGQNQQSLRRPRNQQAVRGGQDGLRGMRQGGPGGGQQKRKQHSAPRRKPGGRG